MAEDTLHPIDINMIELCLSAFNVSVDFNNIFVLEVLSVW